MRKMLILITAALALAGCGYHYHPPAAGNGGGSGADTLGLAAAFLNAGRPTYGSGIGGQVTCMPFGGGFTCQ